MKTRRARIRLSSTTLALEWMHVIFFEEIVGQHVTISDECLCFFLRSKISLNE